MAVKKHPGLAHFAEQTGAANITISSVVGGNKVMVLFITLTQGTISRNPVYIKLVLLTYRGERVLFLPMEMERASFV